MLGHHACQERFEPARLGIEARERPPPRTFFNATRISADLRWWAPRELLASQVSESSN